MGELVRYADAFAVDQGPAGCWRYVYDGGGASGRPRRCPGVVMWAGVYRVRDGRWWRVWSCDGHLAGGERWVGRPDRGEGGHG